MMKKYWISMKLIFTNPYGVLTLIAFICKSPFHKVKYYYMSIYFTQIWPGPDYERYLFHAQWGGLLCVPICSILQSIFIDFLSKKTTMAVGIVIFAKSLGDIAMDFMIFSQQSNVNVAYAGLYFEYCLVNAYNGMLIVMMQTVVDEKASNFCIVIIFFLDMMMTMVTAPILEDNDPNSPDYQKQYF